MSSTNTIDKNITIKSKWGEENAQRIFNNLKQGIISVDDLFQMVVADESDFLHFLTFDLFYSMNFHKQQKIKNVLSVVYDKMVLLNLGRIECFGKILMFLTYYQYNYDVNGGRLKSQVVKTDNKTRLDLIKKCVDTILKTVSPKDHYHCDDKILFLLKTISKNLFLMGSSKSKLLNKNFPVDSMEFCLNIFVMIHQKQPEYIGFKLALNKVDIIRMLERFQLSLRNNNEKDNIILLESYYEVTALGTNMAHYRKRLELYWRFKTISSPSSISFPQLMTRLKNILTYKIMTMAAVLVVEMRVKMKLEAFEKRNSGEEREKLREEILNPRDNDKIKYKDMIVVYYATSNCDNKNNNITRYIRSAESRVIRTPFDKFVFKLFLILKSDFYSAPGMDDWRYETQTTIKDRQPQRRFNKSTNKKFNRQLERKTNRIKNIYALNKIMQSITAALIVDVEKCGDIGYLAIRRALHVIGEFTKFTSSTKHISKEFSDYMKTLHQCLSLGSSQKIRDMLSHNYSLYRIKRLKGMKSCDYKDMQSDLQNLQCIFHSMYRYYLHFIDQQFCGTLFNCKSDMEAKSLLDYIHDVTVVTCHEVQHSSQIWSLLKDVLNNLIPILKKVSFEDLSLDKVHSVNIQSLIMVTSAVIKKTTRPPVKYFYYNWLHTIMKFSSLIHLQKYISQCLLNVWRIPIQNYFYKEEKISLIHRLLLTISHKLNYKHEAIFRKIRGTMSVIEKKYALFLKIDQMKHFLDSGKNNIILELDILRSLDEIYLELGLSRFELQRQDENNWAFDELMKKLFSHTSIFEIKEKFEALGKYFHTLGRSFHDQLEGLKKKEEQYIQQFLDGEISFILRIPQTETAEPFYHNGLQMLLLEILDILHVRNIKSNLFQLDEVTPVLCGNNMRNYLAHGSISIEVVTCTEIKTAKDYVLFNLSALLYFKHQFELFVSHHDVIEMPKSKNDWNFDEQTKCIEAQAQLEELMRTLNITKLRLATRRGAFFNGRDNRGKNIFEIFLHHHLQIYEKFETDKSSLTPEQFNFVQEFLGLLPPECRLNAKYPAKPRNILREAIEVIAEGASSAIETEILQFACASDSVETVELIIKNNSNFDLNCSLAMACHFSRLHIITLLLEKIEIIELDANLCHGLINSNDIRTFKMIIPKCRDINVTIDEEMNTILSLTVFLSSDFDIIKYLIDQDADIAHQDSRGDTLTHISVRQSRGVLLKYLITKGIDCNVPNYLLHKPLHLASTIGNSDIIETLLKYGQVNLEDLISALVEIIENHRNDNFFMLFQKYRAQIKDGYMNKLFRSAVWMKNYTIVEFFISDVKFKCYILFELLRTSVLSHDYNLFEMLLNCAEEQQQTLDQTKINVLILDAAPFNNFKIIERLIRLGADYTPKFRIPPNGCTLLHVLVQSPLYDTQALRFLLTLSKSGLNAVDKSGRTPLYYAVGCNNIVTAFILLKSGADVKLKNHDKNSVLHEACRLKNIKMIELLVRYGAIEQITWKNINGHTPLVVAREGVRDDTLIPYLEKLELSQHWILICKYRKIKFHPKLIRLLREKWK